MVLEIPIPKPVNKSRFDKKKLSDKESVLKELKEIATAKEIKQTKLEEVFEKKDEEKKINFL